MSGYLVLGIDPSIASTGFAWSDGSTSTSHHATNLGDKRLVHLRDDLFERLNSDVVYQQRVGMGPKMLAVIEDLPKNAQGAGITGRAQGVIREVLQRCSIPYVTVAPSTLKKQATGDGRASKADMRVAWLERLNLKEGDVPGVDDNQVDAWWLREIGLHRIHGDQPGLVTAIDWSPWGREWEL